MRGVKHEFGMLFTHEGSLKRHTRAPKHQRHARASTEKFGRIARGKKGFDGRWPPSLEMNVDERMISVPVLYANTAPPRAWRAREQSQQISRGTVCRTRSRSAGGMAGRR